ncbi:helix-turn-helix domain-containing protein [Streptomyces pacificus]|uniref:helix-turn-helix domain-containing protein n=1 Tax=Streptomyces pacificus TaxID=2705029 RepID=UPI001565EC36
MAQAAQLLRLSRIRAAANSGEARRLREAAHLSIAEVARACGVDQSTVWRWERGTRRPRGRQALAYGELIDSLRSAAESSSATTTTPGCTPTSPVEHGPLTTSAN